MDNCIKCGKPVSPGCDYLGCTFKMLTQEPEKPQVVEEGHWVNCQCSTCLAWERYEMQLKMYNKQINNNFTITSKQ